MSNRVIFFPGLGGASPLGLVGELKPFLSRALPVIKEIQDDYSIISDRIKNTDLFNDDKSPNFFLFVFQGSNFRKFTQDI